MNHSYIIPFLASIIFGIATANSSEPVNVGFFGFLSLIFFIVAIVMATIQCHEFFAQKIRKKEWEERNKR